MSAPTLTEIAILKTLLYADVFSYPMTEQEIHHYLIEQAVPFPNMQQTLQQSDWLAQRISRVNGYYAIHPENANLRHQRSAISDALWKQAMYYGKLMAYFPFVRMVALTGALSMRNAQTIDEDLDYLIITTPERVWLARLCIIILVRLARLWGVEICPNYILSERQLGQNRKDLFIAHELVQMVPISGHRLYDAMRRANPWADAIMPNANGTFFDTPTHRPNGWGKRIQRAAEWVFSGALGRWLENWEHRRKARKFAREEAKNQHSAALINTENVKGHFNDYGHPVLKRYYQRLREYGID